MKISILGCGWLGYPLAIHLLKSGHTVHGSTTSQEKLKKLERTGIVPHIIEVPGRLNGEHNNDFWNCDLLFLNIPPGRGSSNVEESYKEQVSAVAGMAQKHGIPWVIFAGSTSVYANDAGIVTEKDAVPGNTSRPSGEAVLAAETLLQEQYPFDVTIIRLGGLYGYDRHPVRYMAGRKGIKNPEQPVNLVHQDDCVEIVNRIIEMDKRNEIYNAVSDGHPPRRTFYISAAEHFGLEPPDFDEEGSSTANRIVSNEKLKRELNYEFIYPNPMDHTP